jgi:hypothetical protein
MVYIIILLNPTDIQEYFLLDSTGLRLEHSSHARPPALFPDLFKMAPLNIEAQSKSFPNRVL